MCRIAHIWLTHRKDGEWSVDISMMAHGVGGTLDHPHARGCAPANGPGQATTGCLPRPCRRADPVGCAAALALPLEQLLAVWWQRLIGSAQGRHRQQRTPNGDPDWLDPCRPLRAAPARHPPQPDQTGHGEDGRTENEENADERLTSAMLPGEEQYAQKW